MVLDADYRIVEIGPAFEAGYGHLRDQSLWEVEPEARAIFGPHYEKAWRTGEPVEIVEFFMGRVVRVVAVARAGRLQLTWEVLHRLDILTLEGLQASLQEAIASVEASEGCLTRTRSGRHLHALEGADR